MARFRLTIVNTHTDLLYCCKKEIIQRVSKGGKVVRAFASDQCGLNSNPSEVAPRHILLKFVFGFHPFPERFFSDTSVFLLSSKTNNFKFNSIRNC